MRRLHDSAALMMMDLPFSVEELVEATKETVRVNDVDSCYIRPIAFLGYGEMGLNPLPCPVNVSIALWPWGTYLGDEGVKRGVRMKISTWLRMDPNINPVAAKGTGIYVNSSLAKVEVLKGGYDEAILLNTNGTVSEATGENIFVVRDGRLVTPPLHSGALAGITRDTVMTIARDLGYEVVEDDLLRTDLYLAEEAFLTGTAAEIVPIREVDDREVGDPGEITRKIQETYFAVVRGELEKYADWLEHARDG
jgi:branched-chain amino acid aminotransferase